MWYEKDDQFIRAPTPVGYDNLVNELQDRDSVVFESISLPSPTKNARNSQISLKSRSYKNGSPRRTLEKSIKKISYQDCYPMTDSNDRFSFNYSPTRQQNNSINSFDDNNDSLEEKEDNTAIISDLQERIDVLERKSIEYEKEAIEKDGRISELEQALSISNKENESLEKYKKLYESTLSELVALKEALSNEGKVKRVKLCSAKLIRRPIKK